MSGSKSTSDTAHEAPPWAAGTEGRLDELYPALSQDEIDVVRAYGEERTFEHGTLLWDIGERDVEFYLVLSGEMEILRRDVTGTLVLTTHSRGNYSGEVITMSGRGAFVAGRAKGDLRAIAVTPGALRDLLALEAELGEKILLSFILRRMRMIAHHWGDVFLVGEASERMTADIREFLSRNGVPYTLVDPATEDEALQPVLAEISPSDLPLVICGDQFLTRPTIREVADCLGLSALVPSGAEFDVTVVGAGPGGLAAAVYAASEGLSVLVLESCAIGGQAGSSSRIENYLGFPTGISGQALTGRGFLQAQKFGAEVAIAREAVALECGDTYHTVHLDHGDHVKTRAVVIATGAVYRQPEIAGLKEFESTAVHYGASHIEGTLCRDKDVVIIGGGNSAGQAAIFLASRARHITILIRGESLAASMSAYLTRRIERTPNITLMPWHQVVSIEGGSEIETLLVRNTKTGKQSHLEASHLFIFIGAQPASSFVGAQVALDDKGFILTGDALSESTLKAAGWKQKRPPHLLETSCPRVFAVGDIRAGSVKRVASAVGEGSVCVQFVHKVLESDST